MRIGYFEMDRLLDIPSNVEVTGIAEHTLTKTITGSCALFNDYDSIEPKQYTVEINDGVITSATEVIE